MKSRIGLVVAMAAVAVAGALVLAGCGGSSGGSGGYTAPAPPPATGGATGGTTAPATGAVKIIMKDFAFDPTTPTAKVGQKITFENQDGAPHNIKLNGKDSGNLAQGASFDFVIDKAGTYPFVCTIHPQMTGTLTVQ